MASPTVCVRERAEAGKQQQGSRVSNDATVAFCVAENCQPHASASTSNCGRGRRKSRPLPEGKRALLESAAPHGKERRMLAELRARISVAPIMQLTHQT